MASSLTIQIDDQTGFSGADRKYDLAVQSRAQHISKLIDHLSKVASGDLKSKLYTDISSSALVAATGTVVFATAVTGQTVTLNGVAFTAVSGSPTALQFTVGGTNAEAATGFAYAVNTGASGTALIKEFFSASVSNATVTLTSKIRGVAGNAFTLASSNGGTLAVSGARLLGGTGGSSQPGATGYVFGGV